MNTKQPFHAWICPRCGQKNTKAFCGNCGLSRENASHISTLDQNKIKAGNIVKNIRIPTISNPAEKIENFNANHERGIRRCLLAVIIVLSMVLIGLVLYRLPATRAIVRSWLPQTNTVISAEMKQEQEKQVENVKKQEETARKAKEKKKEDAEREKQKKEGQDAPKKKFEEFHKYISDHAMQKAYQCLSQNFRSTLAYDDWAPGFNDTISSTPSNIRIVSANENKVVLSYDLKSRDRNGSAVKVQEFQGKTTLIKENGDWVIDAIEANKKGEHIES